MCFCGDLYCNSCGPAQGNFRCANCGKWSFDGGCEKPDECQEKCRIMADDECKRYQEEESMKDEINNLYDSP